MAPLTDEDIWRLAGKTDVTRIGGEGGEEMRGGKRRKEEEAEKEEEGEEGGRAVPARTVSCSRT